MSNTQSSKGKYILAALIGVAVGGSLVALSTRAGPKLMSGMMTKCKRMMADTGQAPQQEACHSQGGSCHGSD